MIPSQAANDDAVHFGKLLGSEFIDPSLNLAPCTAIIPGGTVVGWFEDTLRFLVEDHPTIDERIVGGFEDGGVLPDSIKKSGSDLGVAWASGRKT